MLRLPAFVFRYQFREMLKDFIFIPRFNYRLKVSEPTRKELSLDIRSFENANLFMVGRKNVFSFERNLLEELFSGTHTRDADFDILIGHKTGKMNHVVSQIQYSDRFSHIQYKDVRALSHSRCLQDQLHGLPDAHEVPPHVTMCQRHRTTGGDLSAKRRNNTAVAFEDVTEANGNEVRGVIHPVGCGGDDQFRNSLRKSHNACRVYSLVGRNHYETAHTALTSDFHKVAGTEHVVPDSLKNVRFHQRNVFVGRRVIDGLNGIPTDNLGDASRVTNVCDHGNDIEPGMCALQFLVDLKQVAFGPIQYDQGRGRKGCCLTTQLRSDRAGCAGDQDRFTCNTLLDAVFFEPDLFPTQEILKRDVPELIGQIFPIQEISDTGYYSAIDAGPAATRVCFTHLSARCRGHSQNDLLYLHSPVPITLYDLCYISTAADDRHIHDSHGPR